MAGIMIACLHRIIQPLKAKAHPMYMYTDEDDMTRSITGFFEGRSLREMVSLMMKAKTSSFPEEPKISRLFCC